MLLCQDTLFTTSLVEERSDFLTDLFTCLTPGAVFVNADKYAHDDTQRQCQELGWQLATLEKHYAASID
jgi:hypothetical protein